MMINRELIFLLDLTLGIPSLLLDEDTLRRSLYGKAGCNRTKRYGTEYRTLSSFWIKSDELILWTFNNVERAIQMFNEEKFLTTDVRDVIREIINTGDRERAKQVIDLYKIEMPVNVLEREKQLA